MPIYEYRCDACGQHLETMQGIKEDPLTTCPSCGAEQLKRLISSTSFVLKGSGWYQSDYGAKPAPPASESSGGGASSSED